MNVETDLNASVLPSTVEALEAAGAQGRAPAAGADETARYRLPA